MERKNYSMCVCVFKQKVPSWRFFFVALDVDDVVVFGTTGQPIQTHHRYHHLTKFYLYIAKKTKLLFKHFQNSEFSEKNHKTSLFEIYDEINRICANKTIMIIYTI